jgi:pimeloyl-ACP methyl ester carboxylesterase
MSTIHSHFTDINGRRTHYLRGGAGTPLLLLHGWPEWSHVWRPVMSQLVGRFALIAPDFRGFGDTQKTAMQPAKDATPDVLASDILALADQLRLERFGMVAHDVGGFVAQVIARRAPQRVQRLIYGN